MDDLIRNRNAKFAAFQQEIDTLKETLSNQAQRIKPKLYYGSVIAKEHDVISMIDDEETLILEEESRSKIIEAPSKLSKVCLVNESLKKLKYQLASFDKVVKKRTTSDAITADEITEVQTVFNQLEAAVNQCSVDKNAFEIQIKQLRIDNDQLLKQIMSQEIMHIAVILWIFLM
ncbi:hypothetical protein Tco_0671037 [Tanacetum coccineum]